MSSREIAELTGKNHADVLRDIRRMLEDLDMGLSKTADTQVNPQNGHLKFQGVYLAGNGEQRPEFNLDKELTTTLVAGYSTVLRHRIVKRWNELEAKVVQAPPPMLTPAQAILAMAQGMVEMEQRQQGLIIADNAIRQDAEGRYCLNDLHRASGGEKRHQPANFTRTEGFNGLLGALLNSEERELVPLSVVGGGAAASQGTYVVKELVYAYAMWISPKFHLQVIRAYDAMMAPRPAQANVPAIPQTLPEALRLAADEADRANAAEARVALSAIGHLV